MKKLLICLLFFGFVQNSHSTERNRALDIAPLVGLFTTHNFLSTPNQTQFISGITFQISAFEHVGYFVEGFVGPSQRRDIQITTRPDGSLNIWGYTDSYIVALSAGPFVQYKFKSIISSYRIGYTAAGDGQRGAEFLTQGITLTRLFQETWVTRLDLRQFLKNWHQVGISYSIGFGRRF